jgi:uncharacterized protein (DUF1330 family)
MTTLTQDAIERFFAEDDGQPVVMLNLVRFQPDGGRALYEQYLHLAGPALGRLGAEILFAGDGLTPLAANAGEEWDAVALVRYPSRRAFADLLADPDYQKADPLRVSALSAAVLQPLSALGGAGS